MPEAELLTDTEQDERVKTPEEPWSNSMALTVAKRDFESSENFLSSNHYSRWLNADSIYLAWVAQKYWEGTRVPRATPAVWLAFQQIESFLPKYMSTVFGNDPFAEAVPMPGSTPENARISRDYIIDQFENAKGRKAIRLAVKSALTYGNGILEAGWETFTRKRSRTERKFTPRNHVIDFPGFGRMQIPTGSFKISYKQIEEDETINRPFLRNVSIRDFFIDPNCPTPDVQDARFAGKRVLMTVDELDQLRDEEGFSIPEMSALIEMSHVKPGSQGDTQKSTAASFRGESYQPNIDKTSDPAGKTIEVIQYSTKSRAVWLLNREWVSYNEENSYRNSLGDSVIPFYDLYYTDVMDRFYCLGITDVTEWDQRVIASLLGGHLDEVALNLSPPRLKKLGRAIPAYQMRRRPGAVAEVEDTKDGLVQEAVSNVTGGVFADIQMREFSSQKTTGVSDLAVQGSPSSGGNAAARTATGAGIQAGAASGRLIYHIENGESECLEPILDFFAGMNRDFLDPNEMLQYLGPGGETKEADPLNVMNSRVKFKMRAGSRERSKAALQQMFPLISQTFMNPEFLQLLGTQQGKTLDVLEVGHILLDIAGYKARNALFRDLTPEEKQAMQPKPEEPPPPDPTKIQMQEQRLLAQAKGQKEKLAASSESQEREISARLIEGALKKKDDKKDD